MCNGLLWGCEDQVTITGAKMKKSRRLRAYMDRIFPTGSARGHMSALNISIWPILPSRCESKIYLWAKKKKMLICQRCKRQDFFRQQHKTTKTLFVERKNEFQESSNLLLSSAAHSQLLRDNSWKHLVLKQQRRSQNNSDIAVFLKDNELR